MGNVGLYNAPIGDEGFSDLAAAVAERQSESNRPNCLLILVTFGGSANSGYQIARLLQQTYKKFILFAPSTCKSAGTIVALGAHSIIMDVFSELGPLDVQLPDKDELFSRKSGLATRSSFEALAQESFSIFSHHMLNIKLASGGLITFRLAAELAAKMTADLMSPVFSQLNPDVIGSDFRDLSVATEYGVRLAKVSKNPKDDAITRLVEFYPSHDFIIDKDEAASLFYSIEEPSLELYTLVGNITRHTYRPLSIGLVTALTQHEVEDPEPKPKDELNDDQSDEERPGTESRVEQAGVDEDCPSDCKGDKREVRS